MLVTAIDEKETVLRDAFTFAKIDGQSSEADQEAFNSAIDQEFTADSANVMTVEAVSFDLTPEGTCGVAFDALQDRLSGELTQLNEALTLTAWIKDKKALVYPTGTGAAQPISKLNLGQIIRFLASSTDDTDCVSVAQESYLNV